MTRDRTRRLWWGLLAAASVAAVAPVLAAAPSDGIVRSAVAADAASAGGLGSFTPSAPDPVLARLLHSVSSANAPVRTALRFTPTVAPVLPGTATVATHARPVDLRDNLRRGPVRVARPTLADTSEVATLAVKPLAYKLGESVGWKSFARRDVPVTTERALTRTPVGVERPGSLDTPSRFGSDFKLEPGDADGRPTRGLLPDPSLDLDVSGKYRVSRSVDLKAGVRYRLNREALSVDPQTSADSSAVYVGTAFKF